MLLLCKIVYLQIYFMNSTCLFYKSYQIIHWKKIVKYIELNYSYE